jgi:ribosomal protein S18 acetylase RimI-like enzyme
MDLGQAIETEHRVVLALGQAIDGDGYRAFRSENWPTIWSANRLHLDQVGGRTLGDLEALFTRHFAPDRYTHRAFVFGGEGGARLADEARGAGYQVATLLYLVADRPAPVDAQPDAALHPVDRAARWELLRRFMHATSDDAHGPALVDMFHQRARALTDSIGVEWWYAGPPDGSEMWSKLGLFSHGAASRLQDVETLEAYRRRGLAGLLLGHAIDRALARATSLVVCADAHYHALSLYRRLGFRDIGTVFEAIRRPERS